MAHPLQEKFGIILKNWWDHNVLLLGKKAL
jgi:hypothetical protein